MLGRTRQSSFAILLPAMVLLAACSSQDSSQGAGAAGRGGAGGGNGSQPTGGTAGTGGTSGGAGVGGSVFRAVALYAGAQRSGCNGGAAPIPFFAAHGISDGVLDISRGRTLRDHFVSVNGCTSQNPPEPTAGSGAHICTSYQGCQSGHPVRCCPFDGDHTPSSIDRDQNTTWLPQEVWNFFSQF